MHRKKGLGRIMLQLFEEYLTSQNVVGITLMCQPADSEAAWIKMQFSRMPNYLEENEVKMHKIIVAHQPNIQYDEGRISNQILVWDAEPIRVKGQNPLYCWEPSFAENGASLVLPIIFPSQPDWSIAWKRNGQIEKPVKVKYFNRKNDISHGEFGIITVLEHQ